MRKRRQKLLILPGLKNPNLVLRAGFMFIYQGLFVDSFSCLFCSYIEKIDIVLLIFLYLSICL